VAPALDLPVPDDEVHEAGPDGTGLRGRRQLELLEHRGLLPTSHVVEVGCGIGRLAYVLASYLEPEGRYAGFDVSEPAIRWLDEHYAPRLPNFRFDLVELHHPRFSPDGSGSTLEARFPYEDARFDLACSFSVFQHLPLEQIERYLHEIRRVLRPGGTAVISQVVILPDDVDLTAAKRPFQPVGEGRYETMPGNPITGYAYDEALLRSTIAAAGLDVADFIPGSWHHGRPAPLVPHVMPDAWVLRAP
jgi:SAM-dependent methyltransferase